MITRCAHCEKYCDDSNMKLGDVHFIGYEKPEKGLLCIECYETQQEYYKGEEKDAQK